MERTCREVAAAAGTVLLADASYIPANEPKAEGPPDYSRATSSLQLRQRIATGRDSGHAKTFMFNEIVKGSQDAGGRSRRFKIAGWAVLKFIGGSS